MATFKRFEDIEAWQAARQLTAKVYLASREPPLSRDFRFAAQITSASTSIMSNIAEGFERDNRKDFVQFLHIAKGSAGEVRSLLYVASDCHYISREEFDDLYERTLSISRMIASLIGYLKRTNIAGHRHKQPETLKP